MEVSECGGPAGGSFFQGPVAICVWNSSSGLVFGSDCSVGDSYGFLVFTDVFYAPLCWSLFCLLFSQHLFRPSHSFEKHLSEEGLGPASVAETQFRRFRPCSVILVSLLTFLVKNREPPPQQARTSSQCQNRSAPNRAISAITIANFHQRSDIAAISGTLLNREALRCKPANLHR